MIDPAHAVGLFRLMLESLLYPLDQLISLQLQLAEEVYGRYQVPMFHTVLERTLGAHTYLLSSPWFRYVRGKKSSKIKMKTSS